MTTIPPPPPGRVEYRATSAGGVDLFVDGQPARAALRPMRPKRAAQVFADELNRAVGLGAAHGPCDQHRELADALSGRETPGHVTYYLHHDATPVARTAGCEEPVTVPDVRPLTCRVEFAAELSRAFQIGGQAPPPAAEPDPAS